MSRRGGAIFGTVVGEVLGKGEADILEVAESDVWGERVVREVSVVEVDERIVTGVTDE